MISSGSAGNNHLLEGEVLNEFFGLQEFLIEPEKKLYFIYLRRASVIFIIAAADERGVSTAQVPMSFIA